MATLAEWISYKLDLQENNPAPANRRKSMQTSVLVTMIAVAAGANLAHSQSVESLDAQARAAYNAKDYERASVLSKQVYEALRQQSSGREEFELATAALNVGQSL